MRSFPADQPHPLWFKFGIDSSLVVTGAVKLVGTMWCPVVVDCVAVLPPNNLFNGSFKYRRNGDSMKFYLKWVNPFIALLVLILCVWLWLGSYFVPGKGDNGISLFQKGLSPFNLELMFPLYFFAKGLFCSALLFVVGEFFKRQLEKDKES